MITIKISVGRLAKVAMKIKLGRTTVLKMEVGRLGDMSVACLVDGVGEDCQKLGQV